MKNDIIHYTFCIIVAVLTTNVWGLEINRSSTSVFVELIPPGQVILHRAQLSNYDFRDLPSSDVFVSWRQVGLPSGQVEVLIPAGCFIRNSGLQVENFEACGVQIMFTLGASVTPLLIEEFDARVLPRSNGTARFIIETRLIGMDQHAFFGVLGGAAVEITIGTENATALPQRVKTTTQTPDPW